MDNSASSESTASPPSIPAAKKKRSLPGMPDPDAEVIWLSPKSLLATNRFVCEVCKKGFQRDQNLQLHRRGHNLPWKLRQRNGTEVRKRVYVCPEQSCVHHDPSRALGDLTGIKKHYCRKHGEKKWSCDKCGKKYAVMSDWKAHLKTCGTKEYRCHCGTLFSRRDSFITHRALCVSLAVAEESKAGSPEKLAMESEEPDAEAGIGMLEYLQPPALAINSSDNNRASTNSGNNNDNNNTSLFASLFSSTSPSVATAQTTSFTEFLSSVNHQPEPTSLHLSQFIAPSTPTPQLSATALLQKAAQMGAATSSTSLLRGLGLATLSNCPPPPSDRYWEHDDPTAIGLGLGLPKRATLDLLGLGIGLGSTGGGLSALMTSIGGGGLDIGPGLSWDEADRKPSSSAIL